MISETVHGIQMTFETDDKSFSPLYLDKGTLAMLSCVAFSPEDKVLDLGCGYGLVGILAAKLIGEAHVVMSDIDAKSVALSKENAKRNGVGGVKVVQSDGFHDMQDRDFTLILSNPPYHVDFSVPKHFIEKGFNRLKLGGKLYMVTKRKDWYKNKLIGVFGGVKIEEIAGYFVFCAEKRSTQYASAKRKK